MDEDNIRQLADRAAARAPEGPRVLPGPNAPLNVANQYVHEHRRTTEGLLTLRHWRDDWWEWRGSRWVEIEHRAVRRALYDFTETAVYEHGAGTKAVAIWGRLAVNGAAAQVLTAVD